MTKTKKKKGLKRWDEIIRRLPVGPVKMAEVGVWMGKNAFNLLNRCPMLEIWLIDRWKRPTEGDSYLTSGAEMAVKPQDRFDDAYHAAVTVASKFRKRTHIIIADTVAAAAEFQDATFDCVFIDADHSYEGCLRDICAWLPKVKPGGLICGHDYANTAGNVKEAVDEMFVDMENKSNPLHRITLGGDHTWFVRL